MKTKKKTKSNADQKIKELNDHVSILNQSISKLEFAKKQYLKNTDSYYASINITDSEKDELKDCIADVREENRMLIKNIDKLTNEKKRMKMKIRLFQKLIDSLENDMINMKWWKLLLNIKNEQNTNS